ncbi:hypothetical protein BUALT_Bualt09G0036100 [Buddleja alternifolia]|uniref:Uncharacterized protein n=1 Tax=Buddleja alternifolia TaxID=168488 RepID=A0AAV6X6X5_9LAMI|nr:hypothetical protein BUALT_Bualt09G0036100 [Buddleja alternifolia]
MKGVENNTAPLKKWSRILGRGNSEKTTRIGSQMLEKLEMMMIDFLRKNAEMFAWQASNFKGIEPKAIMHRLNIDPKAKLVK